MTRRTALMRDAGPYQVVSRSNGVLTIYAEWPDTYNWEEGWGGPGLFSRAGLADDIQQYLNQPYEDKPCSAFGKLARRFKGIHRLKAEDKR